MMKKHFTAVLAVLCLLLGSLFMTPVSALGAEVTVSLDTVYKAAVGDTVTVTLSVSDDHYITCGQIAVFYDPAQLALKPIEDDVYIQPNTALLGDSVSWELGTPTPGECYFVFAGLSSIGVATGGELFTLTFDVLDGFDGEEDITLSVEELVSNDGVTKKGKDYNTDYTLKNGKVLARTKGDVVADGMVNIIDAANLFYYVAGRETLSETQLYEGNVTGDDSEVNIYDVMAVYQYVNGVIDTI